MNTVRTIVRTVLWAVLGFLALGFVLGQTTSASESRTEPSDPFAGIERCVNEGGSGTVGYTEQMFCVWDDGTGDKILNIDAGRFEYNITTNTFTDHSNDR